MQAKIAPRRQLRKSAGPKLADHRAQLLAGFARSVEDVGFAATKIADVVRHARVSRRTFYEHFADKEECFMAAYADFGEQILAAIAAKTNLADGAVDWERPIRAAVGAYLDAVATRPKLSRAFLFEIMAAGRRALELRRRVLARFADLARSLVEEGRKLHPEVRPLSPALAMAIVAGINELVLVESERGAGADLASIAEAAFTLLRGVLAPVPRATRSG